MTTTTLPSSSAALCCFSVDTQVPTVFFFVDAHYIITISAEKPRALLSTILIAYESFGGCLVINGIAFRSFSIKQFSVNRKNDGQKLYVSVLRKAIAEEFSNDQLSFTTEQEGGKTLYHSLTFTV